MKELAARRPGVRAPDVAARPGARVLQDAGRDAEGPADRREDGRPVRGVGLHDQGPRHLRRLLRRPARPLVRPAQGLPPALDVERLLEGRREERADAAHLRHGVLQRQGARRLPHADRGGEEARPPQGRQGARPLHVPPVGAGRGLLARQGDDALPHARGLHARGAASRPATTRSARRSSTTRRCGRPRGTGSTTARTCSSSSPSTSRWP